MATIQTNLFDGTRQLFRPDSKVLVSLRDHKQKVTSTFKPVNAVNFNVEFDEGRPDHNNYAILASSGDCSDIGFFPVAASKNGPVTVDLMLRPRHPSYNFAQATWDAIVARAGLHSFLSGEDEDLARAAFSQLKETPPVMACLLNIVCAIDLLPLTGQEQLLPLFKRIELRPGAAAETEGIRQDRFFAWADPAIKPILQARRTTPLFEEAPPGLHPGANLSYKEVRFGEANLQFTFHEREQSPPGTNWVKLELDMDCYRDVGAHILLEVIPNEFITRLFKPHLTDPANIYALRWMAGRHAGEGSSPEPGQPPRASFEPLFSLRA